MFKDVKVLLDNQKDKSAMEKFQESTFHIVNLKKCWTGCPRLRNAAQLSETF